MLKIDNASARIAGITVLRDITTEFKPGQLLAVVGRNGAGKTTLLRAINQNVINKKMKLKLEIK